MGIKQKLFLGTEFSTITIYKLDNRLVYDEKLGELALALQEYNSTGKLFVEGDERITIFALENVAQKVKNIALELGYYLLSSERKVCYDFISGIGEYFGEVWIVNNGRIECR